MRVIFSAYSGSFAIGHPRSVNCSRRLSSRSALKSPQSEILLYPTSNIRKFGVFATHGGIVFNSLCATRNSLNPLDDFNASIPSLDRAFFDRFTLRSAGLSLKASPTSRSSHSAHANVFNSFNPRT